MIKRATILLLLMTGLSFGADTIIQHLGNNFYPTVRLWGSKYVPINACMTTDGAGDLTTIASSSDISTVNSSIGTTNTTLSTINGKIPDAVSLNSVNHTPVAPASGASFRNITTATTTVVKSAAGFLFKVCVNTIVNGATLTLYDNTAASGTKIATQTLDYTVAALTTHIWSPACQNIDGAIFSTGLTAVSTGTADWTIYYK